MPTPAAIKTKARSLRPGTIIELFTADLSSIRSKFTGQPGPVYAFHSSETQGSGPLTFQTIAYQPFPLAASGFEMNSSGKLPRPTISFSNVGAVMSSLLREYKELNGAKVIRRRTLFEYLDGEAEADTTQEFIPDIYFVDRKVLENKTVVTLELASNFDVEGVMLPRRQLTANSCPFHYRSGDGCDYAGPPVTDENGNLFSDLLPGVMLNNRSEYDPASTYNRGDYAYRVIQQPFSVPVGGEIIGVREYSVCLANGTLVVPPSPAGLITDPTKWTRDVCTKTLNACRLRFGADAVLPFGGFPGIIRAPGALS